MGGGGFKLDEANPTPDVPDVPRPTSPRCPAGYPQKSAPRRKSKQDKDKTDSTTTNKQDPQDTPAGRQIFNQYRMDICHIFHLLFHFSLLISQSQKGLGRTQEFSCIQWTISGFSCQVLIRESSHVFPSFFQGPSVRFGQRFWRAPQW